MLHNKKFMVLAIASWISVWTHLMVIAEIVFKKITNCQITYFIYKVRKTLEYFFVVSMLFQLHRSLNYNLFTLLLICSVVMPNWTFSWNLPSTKRARYNGTTYTNLCFTKNLEYILVLYLTKSIRKYRRISPGGVLPNNGLYGEALP